MAVYCAVYYTQRFCVTRAMVTASAHVYARHLRTGWEELKGVVTPGDKSPVPDSGRSPAHGKSKIWHKNKWKVRRQRYMYDMLGLVKKGKVHLCNVCTVGVWLGCGQLVCNMLVRTYCVLVIIILAG